MPLPRTLRLRLAATLLGLTALFFGLTFVAVYNGTGAAVRAQIERELKGDLDALRRALARGRYASASEAEAAVSAYLSDQPYPTSSTLLFVTRAGRAISSNLPELFALPKRPERGESAFLQERENRAAKALLSAPSGLSTVAVPDLGALRLLREPLRLTLHFPYTARGDRDPDSTRPVALTLMLGVGEPLGAVASAQAGVSRAFFLAGLVVLVAALLAAWLVGTRFSAPLRKIAQVARSVDGGDLQPRIGPLGKPSEEVGVLANSFNHMLDRLTEAFARQRAFIADASHELRTPLTVLRGQLEVLLGLDAPSPAEVARAGELMEAEVERMGRLVDDLLLLLGSERRELLLPEPIELVPYLHRLWAGVSALAQRRFELAELPAGIIEADPDRLAQALRNLILNAIEHTQAPAGLVRLSLEERLEGEEGRLRFVVDDDGPGVPPAARDLVFDRFRRLEQARDRGSGGAGLGLAIVRAIAHGHRGRVWLEESPAGGTRAILELPGYTALRQAAPI